VSAIVPPRVAPGQTIGVCAPAGPVKLDRLRRGLERLGDVFRVRVADSIAAPRAPASPAPEAIDRTGTTSSWPSETPSYLAASDDVRAAELSALLADPDVRAIVLARGG
jgi:muramoyltetrapeptide carboxypeptidase